MVSQTIGLASEISSDIKNIKTEVIFPWSKLQPGFLPIFKWIFINNIPTEEIPDVVISCGRKSVYLSIYLKKKFSKIINIHIQNPKISSKNFTFVVAPNHDNYIGKNIINSIGALHRFRHKENLNNKPKTRNNNLVSCIIGGENNHYLFRLQEAKNLCDSILNLKKNNPHLEFLIITSRRTNNEIKKIFEKKLKSISKLWLGDGDNPYEFAIYNSGYFIITSDSTSMISEASISGCPIYVYQLPLKRKSIRLIRFHDEFKNLNITRDFKQIKDIQNWSYNKLNESKRIAGIIKKRIIEESNESK